MTDATRQPRPTLVSCTALFFRFCRRVSHPEASASLFMDAFTSSQSGLNAGGVKLARISHQRAEGLHQFGDVAECCPEMVMRISD